uniref:NADH:ubiquinone reductase (H(+)-translocating) n=1 Tax=Cyanea capillata TaxID=27804 RepID=G9ISG5_CYACP|nr:NADH dehydrogenase subunit 2 [Cyanea capillata]
MNYFYFEFLIGVLLLLSLLIFLNSNFVNIISLVFLLFVVTNFNILDFYSTWEITMKIICIIFGLFIYNTLNKQDINSVGVLILSVILAAILIISCNNLLALYICLELQSLSLFILIARKRNELEKVEAALKYFVLSSLSSGLFLLGSALCFIINGSCDIYILSANTLSIEKSLIIVALLFKLASAPFHIWTPDIYQGCDNKSLLILGILPKISIFTILITILPNSKLVLISTILSLLVGSIGALNQTKIKKLLAYSGIINMGFIFLGLVTNSYSGLEASLLYLIIYSISFLLFLLLIDIVDSKQNNIIGLSNIGNINLVILITLVLLILSIAGIPPFAGFFVKWVILEAAISHNFLLTSIISILCAVVAGVYYLRLVKISYFQEDKSFLTWKKALIKENKLSYNNSVISSLLFFLICFILLCPHVLKELAHLSILSIF